MDGLTEPTMGTTRPNPLAAPTPPSAACDAVMGTYELLESIILCLPLPDILHSATKVSNSFHNTITTSVQMSKRILASPRFIHALRNKRVKDTNIFHRTFFWGSVVIKKNFDHRELIYAVDHSAKRPFQPRFLTTVDSIPFLTAADRERFKHGWWMALKTYHGTPGGEKFLARFELGLYKLLDPVYGAQAEQLYRALNKKRGGSTRDGRLPRALVAMWEARDLLPVYEFQEVAQAILDGGS